MHQNKKPKFLEEGWSLLCNRVTRNCNAYQTQALQEKNIFEELQNMMRQRRFITFYRAMMELEMLFKMKLTRFYLE